MTIQGRGGEERKESPVKYLIICLCLLRCHSTADATAPPPSAKVRMCVFVCVCESGGGKTQSTLVGHFYSQNCIISVSFSIIFVYQASEPQRLLGCVFLSPTQALWPLILARQEISQTEMFICFLFSILAFGRSHSLE